MGRTSFPGPQSVFRIILEDAFISLALGFLHSLDTHRHLESAVFPS